MTSRRSFFRSLIAAPAAAIAAPSGIPRYPAEIGGGLLCECGWMLTKRASGRDEFLECSNPGCARRGVALYIPRIVLLAHGPVEAIHGVWVDR